MGKYIFKVRSNTFIWSNQNTILAYNSDNYKLYECARTEEIDKCFNELDNIDNLYVVKLIDKPRDNSSLAIWIDNLIKIDAAELFYIDTEDQYIPSIKPIVRVQENINRIRNNSDVSELLASIKELTIHLSGVKHLSDGLKYHQQIIYPQQADVTIKFEVVKEFISNNNIPSDIKLNIVLGKDFEEKNKIISFLTNNFSQVNLFVRYEDLGAISDIYNYTQAQCNVTILYSLEYRKDMSDELIKAVCECNSNVNLIVKSEEDLINAINISSLIHNAVITPVFCDNLDFFKKYVFTTKTELIKRKLSKRNIFMNQSLNSFFFGKLEIDTNGIIWDKIGLNQLGKVTENISVAMLSIMNNPDTMWFLTREKTICSGCNYKWICPPISNYEAYIGIYNSCEEDNI